MAAPVAHDFGMNRHKADVTIRLATAHDRPAVLRLASRLEEGVARWHDRSGVANAVLRWVDEAMDRVGLAEEHTCFVASAGTEEVLGFISVQATAHWSGTRQAYIGELMVAEQAEGRGIGRALVERASIWARKRNCRRITLTTGAANSRARLFYDTLGFEEEDVTLSRRVSSM